MIPFAIPLKFVAGFKAGQLVRYGALLKDANTGRIVGHMQETGLFQDVLKGVGMVADSGGFLPLGIGNLVQNQRMISKLKDISADLGVLKGMQIGSLAIGVLGIGVSVISTKIILNRLKDLSQHVIDVGQKIDQQAENLLTFEIGKRLAELETEVERYHELPLRKKTKVQSEASEETLHRLASQFYHVAELCAKPDNGKMNITLLWQIVTAIGLTSKLGLHMLIENDEMSVAHRRAVTFYQKFAALHRRLPQDYVATYSHDKESAQAFSSGMTEIRHHLASMPSYIEAIQATGTRGPDYLAVAKEQKDSPYVILPFSQLPR